jgi:hypothetical protein
MTVVAQDLEVGLVVMTSSLIALSNARLNVVDLKRLL